MAHYAPTSTTGRMEAARRHRAKAYGERNELIGVLTRLFPAHVGPVAGNLHKLTERSVVCVHLPTNDVACWVVTQEEVDEYFDHVPRIDVNHWDRATRDERSVRLRKIKPLTKPAPKAKAKGRAGKKR